MNPGVRSSMRRKVPAPIRTKTVFMGRMDYSSVVLRQIAVELYKIRRRTMSKVLFWLCIAATLVTFGLVVLNTIMVLRSPTDSFLPPSCTLSPVQPCLNHPATANDLLQAAQMKATVVHNTSNALRLPDALNVATQIVQLVGLILIIILAGTIVGGEYSGGTIRLILTRSPTRTQFLIAKIGAISICIVIGALTIIGVGLVLSTLLNLITGIPQPVQLLTGMWLFHASLYILIALFGLLVYAMLALCLATVGRATASGVAGALTWALLEPVVGNILYLVGSSVKGPLGSIIQAIPDYFIRNTIDALLQNQAQYIENTGPSMLTNAHALIVLLVYLLIFIGIAWRSTMGRDVTN